MRVLRRGILPTPPKMIAQPRLPSHPADRILEVFKRDVDEAARQPVHAEIAQVQRRIAVRREDRATVFVNASVAAVQHDNGRMRAVVGGRKSVPTMPSVRISVLVTPGLATCRSSINSARVPSGAVASS